MAKEVKPELVLDLVDAAAKRESLPIKGKLRKFEASRPAADDLRSYRECLVGGNASDGAKVFLEKAEVYCVRCHKFNGEGGEVGARIVRHGRHEGPAIYPRIHCVPEQTHRGGIRERDCDFEEQQLGTPAN